VKLKTLASSKFNTLEMTNSVSTVGNTLTFRCLNCVAVLKVQFFKQRIGEETPYVLAVIDYRLILSGKGQIK